jgi:hypothetical protein
MKPGYSACISSPYAADQASSICANVYFFIIPLLSYILSLKSRALFINSIN